MVRVFSLPNTQIEAKIGQVARQADGSVWLTCGNNVVLATVVAEKLDDDVVQDFLPLTVECRERLASVGKIPGGFIKREGKLSDSEVLLSRIVDRSIRPLFPKGLRCDIQVIVTLLSFDGTFPMETLAVLAASSALCAAENLPIQSPVGAVVCTRNGKGGAWEVNSGGSLVKNGAVDHVLVVGTRAGICMLEASCDFIDDADLVNLIENIAGPEINRQILWQDDIQKTYKQISSDALDESESLIWYQQIKKNLPDDYKNYFFAKDKNEFKKQQKELAKLVKEKLQDVFHEENSKIKADSFDVYWDLFIKKHGPQIVIDAGKRFDLRAFDQIRDIECLVDVLPKSHGSSIFTRGQTQALSTITLGAGSDAQRVETLLYGVQDKHFMLHYNFPPFATGEVKPLRGVGRREIGHGYLAEKSFKDVLPVFSTFPYTIRSLVDVLESNGSSSMATVCATMLSMLDAGIPVRQVIAGIAMGLLRGIDGQSVVISDITGAEDSFGAMDFKIIGNENGICAIQVDVKGFEGLTASILAQTLKQARAGLQFIIGKMKEVLPEPRTTLKDSVPRFFSMKISPSKNGLVIGPAGKNIKQIVADTGTQIDISDDGTISIFAGDALAARRAEGWIRALVGEIKSGAAYQGKISRIVPDLGIFVAIVPGKDGLVHISTIDSKKRVDLEKNYKIGDRLDVVVTHADGDGRIKLVAPELEAPDNNLD